MKKRILTLAASLLLLASLLAACAEKETTTSGTPATPSVGSGTTAPETNGRTDPTTAPTVEPTATEPKIDPTNPSEPPIENTATLAPSQTLTVEFAGTLHLRVEAAGWYGVDGDVTVTDYEIGKNKLVYLPAGEYEIVAAGDTAVTLTVAPAEAPNGYSEQTAIAADGTEAKLYKGTTMYFAYTAPADGVYGVAFGLNKTTEQCRFTFDGETYYTAATTVRLTAGQTLIIRVDSEQLVSGLVSMTVSQKFEEELPAEGWVSGIYMNGSMRIVLDRESKTVQYMSYEDPIHFYYLDGQATFTAGETVVTLRMNENGKDIDLILPDSDDPTETKTYILVYREAVEPVTVDKFEGTYVSEDGEKLVIAADGSGIGFNTRFNFGDNGCKYDTEWNTLYWGAYELSIGKLDEGGRVAVIVINEVHYSAVSHDKVTLPPEKLPITSSKYLRYVSEESSFSVDIYESGRQVINGRGFTVLEVTSDGSYVVYGYFVQQRDEDGNLVADGWEQAKWTMKFVGEYIYLYDEEDTLAEVLIVEKVVFHIGELPVSETAVFVPKSDTDVNGNYFLRVTQSGYYKFVEEASNVDIYRNCKENEDDFPTIDYSTRVRVGTGGTTLYLEKGEVLGLYGGDGYGEGVRTLTVLYMQSLPQGYTADDPFVMSGNFMDLSWNVGKDMLYVRYTAKTAGSYTIGFNNRFVAFTVNGKTYGYDYDSFKDYATGATCTVTLGAGESVDIALTRHFDNGETFILGVAPAGTTLENIFANLVEYAAFADAEKGVYEGGNKSEMYFTITVKDTTIDMVVTMPGISGGSLSKELKDIVVEVRDGKYIAKGIQTPLLEIDISFTISGDSLNLTVDGTESYVLYRPGTEPGGTEVELGNVCAAIAGSYVGVDDDSIYFVLGDSMVVNNYSIGAITSAVLEENDGVYTFTYAQGRITVTVTFYDNGYIVINDSAEGEYILVRTED